MYPGKKFYKAQYSGIAEEDRKAIDHSPVGSIPKDIQKQEEEMSTTRWTDEEIKKLKEMAKAGKSKKKIAATLGRTEHAVDMKLFRLGIQIRKKNRFWTPEEDAEFAADWSNPEKSNQYLCRKYNRTRIALIDRAFMLGLGSRPISDMYLTIPAVSEEMQVSYDRVYTWIRLGLKTRKNRSGRGKYLIRQEDLLKFLEAHQDLFNASLISDYLFHSEPDWLKEKRKRDTQKYAEYNRLEYSNDDDKQIVRMFEHGKTDKEIADALGRNLTGLAAHRRVLGLLRNRDGSPIR